jgi:hypothetical protein
MYILRRIDIKRSGEIFRKIESYVEKVIKKLNPSLSYFLDRLQAMK